MDTSGLINDIKSLDVKSLFVSLGWELTRNSPILSVKDNEQYTAKVIAELQGVKIFEVYPTDTHGRMPTKSSRFKIAKEITKQNRENISIFYDGLKTRMAWVWFRDLKTNRSSVREHIYIKGQNPGYFTSRVSELFFDFDQFDDQGRVSLSLVTSKLKSALDVEKVTNKFYKEYEQKFLEFSNFIDGFQKNVERNWYASLLLNRLMFTYFIQQRGFLENNRNYLSNKLRETESKLGSGNFHSFYKSFLLTLFHDGFAKPENERNSQVEGLIGNVPYLNGGLFEPHVVETSNQNITVPDIAFQKIFDFFDRWEWTLDTKNSLERPENEINPDVLGHIFEKFINQKELGAYYTKPDVTNYLSGNTIGSWFLGEMLTASDKTNKSVRNAFHDLREDYEQFIHPSLNHGLKNEKFPDIPPGQLDKVGNPEWVLPSETWREFSARKERYSTLLSLLEKGKIKNASQLIEHNLNLIEFVRSIILKTNDPNVLRTIWHILTNIKVLDPACGSGAFLFSALEILFSLRTTCIDKMSGFKQDVPEFSQILSDLKNISNQPYSIYKSIILSNLYGVDIMDEATEVCKLRLFLKLASQLQPGQSIEPLPDVDFNIRAGNSLLGYKSFVDAKEKIQDQGFQFDDKLSSLNKHAIVFHKNLEKFREGQVDHAESKKFDKEELTNQLNNLESVLNDLFHEEYASYETEKISKSDWIDRQKPFHWFLEFYDILSTGGFSIILGNPPFAEIDKNFSRKALRDEYKSCLATWSRDEDLYTLFIERSASLLNTENGCIGLVLPLSISFSTKSPIANIRRFVKEMTGTWYWSHYDRIPCSLFGNDVRTRCSVGIFKSGCEVNEVFTTPLLRWSHDQREGLFESVYYTKVLSPTLRRIPKLSKNIVSEGLSYLHSLNRPMGLYPYNPISANALINMAPNFPQKSVFVAGTAYNWFPVWRSIPHTTDANGAIGVPSRAIGYQFESEDTANIAFALLASSLGYWWWAVASDGFNLKRWLVDNFPLSPSAIPKRYSNDFANVGQKLKSELEENYVFKDNKGKKGNYYLPACRNTILEIDDLISSSIALPNDFIKSIQSFNATFSRA